MASAETAAETAYKDCKRMNREKVGAEKLYYEQLEVIECIIYTQKSAINDMTEAVFGDIPGDCHQELARFAIDWAEKAARELRARRRHIHRYDDFWGVASHFNGIKEAEKHERIATNCFINHIQRHGKKGGPIDSLKMWTKRCPCSQSVITDGEDSTVILHPERNSRNRLCEACYRVTKAAIIEDYRPDIEDFEEELQVMEEDPDGYIQGLTAALQLDLDPGDVYERTDNGKEITPRDVAEFQFSETMKEFKSELEQLRKELQGALLDLRVRQVLEEEFEGMP